MSILKELLEGATPGATAAHSIAGFRTLFGGMQKRSSKKTKKKKNTKSNTGPIGNVYSFKLFSEAEDSNFTSSDVVTKLKDAEKRAEEEGENTTAFALEDEKGNMVKVWVPDDQADDFMTALEQSLNDVDEDEDDENEGSEIAEVLWNLRNDFDIVNIEWGDIEEDQEEQLPADVEEAPPAGEAGAEAGAEGAPEELTPPEGGEGEGGDEEMTAEPGEEADLGGEEEAKTALQQVIDMMKADAEARKAEADARSAEAKAREAEAGMKVAQDKVKQEEKVLDMEAYYDKEKKEKGETDKLAKLAKYQHDLAADRGMGPGSEQATPEAPPSIPEPPEPSIGGVPEEDEERIMRVGHGGDTMLTKAELGDLVLRALRRQ